MSRLAPREANVEEEFYHLLRNVLEEHKFEVEGVKFSGIEPQYPVDGKKADLMLLEGASKPLMVIECKRKVDTGRGISAFREFDPMSSRVIDQALSYATHTGAPLFATTNGKVFALFLVPERGEPFRIDRHRLLIREIQLNQKVAEEIVTLAARWKSGIRITKTPVDWAFILRLRSFVEYLSSQILPPIESKMKNKLFKDEFERFTREVGGGTSGSYARESAYILMNKIVFHKILERYYGGLSKLTTSQATDGVGFAEHLAKHFVEAMRVTKDFEPVFSAGIYDQAPLPDEQVVLDEINSFIEDMDTYRLEEVGSDVVGFIFERLIPEGERHRLGQFYTPPQIAELISRWAIREPTDLVLDPACGSGTFPVKAYGILKGMKSLSGDEAHREILEQIFALDINPFPAHLTAVNLAMRDVRHPTSEMNVIVEDFFHVSPEQNLMAPFVVKTASGERRRSIVLPLLDAVIGNPPYTKWEEMSDDTREAVIQELGELMSEYGLKAQLRAGLHPGIYMYFVMHATEFLKEGGRLGMIISDSWLQSEIGISFGNFLLDNYKVIAIVDFSSRLFPIPTIATCVVLLERCSDRTARLANKTVFMNVDKETSVDDVLRTLNNPPRAAEDFSVVRQTDIPRNSKWVGLSTGALVARQALESNPRFVKATELFDIFRGGIEFVSRTSGGVGANDFFYLDEETVRKWGLENHVAKMLTGPRYAPHFTFGVKDWAHLKKSGARCYLFNCRVPRAKVPKSVLEYIEWGQSGCRTRTGEICSRAKACQTRESDRKRYAGWYDLGGVKRARFFTGYYARYNRRFVELNDEVALDADFISYEPKVILNGLQIKAVLAFLNSSFSQLYIEMNGRVPGGVGPVSLEVPQAKSMPIPDVRLLKPSEIKRLASLFDGLESKSREVGDTDRRGGSEALDSQYDRLNAAIAEIFEFDSATVKRVRRAVKLLMSRRLLKRESAHPDVLTGEEVPRIRPPKKSRSGKYEPSVPLDKWT